LSFSDEIQVFAAIVAAELSIFLPLKPPFLLVKSPFKSLSVCAKSRRSRSAQVVTGAEDATAKVVQIETGKAGMP
jgi:hypothetical protein